MHLQQQEAGKILMHSACPPSARTSIGKTQCSCHNDSPHLWLTCYRRVVHDLASGLLRTPSGLMSGCTSADFGLQHENRLGAGNRAACQGQARAPLAQCHLIVHWCSSRYGSCEHAEYSSPVPLLLETLELVLLHRQAAWCLEHATVKCKAMQSLQFGHHEHIP